MLITLFLVNGLIFAQKQNHGSKKIRAYKIAFISNKLDLTEEEATKFWPVYNTYDKKVNGAKIRNYISLKKRLKEKRGVKNLSEKEAKEIVLQFLNLEKEIAKANEDFYKKLIRILPYKKIILLRIAENEFQRKLLKRLRGKKKSKN